MPSFKRLQPAIAICAVAFSIILYACSKGGGTGTETPPSGDDEFKKGMLTNYADNIIIPAYTDLQAKLASLEGNVQAFLATPSVATQ